MVRLNREEFRMPLPSALAAAVDIVRASIAFAPVDNDVPRAAKTVDRITGRYSTDVAGDWRLVESYLHQAYQTVPQG
jgi:hypothetical protein